MFLAISQGLMRRTLRIRALDSIVRFGLLIGAGALPPVQYQLTRNNGSWLRDNRIIFFEGIVSCIPIRTFEVELCLNNLSIRAASLQRFPDDQFFVLCHLSEERDDCSVKGFNKVESWTFQISFAELLLSCSSAEPLDEGTYIIRLPLKLVLHGNLIRCGMSKSWLLFDADASDPVFLRNLCSSSLVRRMC
ncbi:hypothetical protein Tco_0413337 [Tanacetum coccineum]